MRRHTITSHRQTKLLDFCLANTSAVAAGTTMTIGDAVR
jgi:hypothetical protein